MNKKIELKQNWEGKAKKTCINIKNEKRSITIDLVVFQNYNSILCIYRYTEYLLNNSQKTLVSYKEKNETARSGQQREAAFILNNWNVHLIQ